MTIYHYNKVRTFAQKFIDDPYLSQLKVVSLNSGRSCSPQWEPFPIHLHKQNGYCANMALIADFIYFKWATDLFLATGGITDSAFAIGFGDIVTMLMTLDPQIGKGLVHTQTDRYIRDLKIPMHYPEDRGSAYHESLIISSTMWDLLKELEAIYGQNKARDIVGHYAFQMIYKTRHYLGAYEALVAINDELINDTNEIANNYCLINKVFARHGLASIDSKCSIAYDK